MDEKKIKDRLTDCKHESIIVKERGKDDDAGTSNKMMTALSAGFAVIVFILAVTLSLPSLPLVFLRVLWTRMEKFFERRRRTDIAEEKKEGPGDLYSPADRTRTKTKALWGSHHHCAIYPGDAQEAVAAANKSFQQCQVHRGHKDFITIDEFRKKSPSEIGVFEHHMTDVWQAINRTVRVVVRYVSTGRPDTFMNSDKPYPCIELRGSYLFRRYGTGTLYQCYEFDDVEEPCPCSECRCKTGTCESETEAPNRKFYYFVIVTSTHVIFDKKEAQKSEFEFFYDSEDRKNVKTAYGVTVLGPDHERLETDRCYVLCVTHDESLHKTLSHLGFDFPVEMARNMLISHPHGVSKRISLPSEITLIKHYITIINKTSIRLRKGTKVRCIFTDGDPLWEYDTCLLSDLPKLEKSYRTLEMPWDLYLYHPQGIVFETDRDLLWNDGYKNERWFYFAPGTQIVPYEGKPHPYTSPYGNDKGLGLGVGESGRRVAVFGKFKSLVHRNDKDKLKIFERFKYRTPTCPGSSGALTDCFMDYINVHFGGGGDYYASGLGCNYQPKQCVGNGTDFDGKKWWDSRQQDYCKPVEEFLDTVLA